jgi:hypothetical protein
MATMRDQGAVTTAARGRPGAARPSRLSITMADLITVIQDVVGPGDEGLVVATVRHLLQSGRLTGRGTGTRAVPMQPQEQRWSHMVTGGDRHPSTLACRRPCGRSPG